MAIAYSIVKSKTLLDIPEKTTPQSHQAAMTVTDDGTQAKVRAFQMPYF